jgi:AraC-like DNA-binding protein
MHVITMLGRLQAIRVRQALSPSDAFTEVSGWQSLLRVLRADHDGVFVLNPLVADPRASDAGARPVLAGPLRAIPFILYVKPTDVRRVLRFIRGGATDILLEGVADTRAEIQQALRSAQVSSTDMVLRHVTRALADKHPDVAALLTELFRSPGTVASAAALTRRAAVSERTLYRVPGDAGLAPVGAVVRAARVLRAFDLVRHRQYTLERAAHAVGLSSARQLSNQLRVITGLPAGAATESLSQDRLVKAVLRDLFRHGDAEWG